MTALMSGTLEAVRVTPDAHPRPAAIPLEEAVRRGEEERRGGPYVQDARAVDFSVERCPDEELFGQQPTRRESLPDPGEWAAHIAQAILEVMAGWRSAPQLVRWTTNEVYAVVARRSALAARRGPQPGSRPATRRAVVLRTVACEPADGVAEVSCVVLDQGRVRAMALRLTGLDGRWKVEALQLG